MQFPQHQIYFYSLIGIYLLLGVFLKNEVNKYLNFKILKSKKVTDHKELEMIEEESNISSSKLLTYKTKQEYNKWYEQVTVNIPVKLLQSKLRFSDPKKCTRFPNLFDLTFNNIYWQSLTTRKNSIAYFLSAYYDIRDLIENRPIIRIISVIKEIDLSSVKYCLIWFKDKKTLIRSNVSSPLTMEITRGPLHTYILSCKVPDEFNNVIPDAVSLVENECDLATNLLTVNFNLPKDGRKEDFAICIKGLDYPHQDLSFYLVEYIELSKLLGVHKIFIYDYDSHPNISTVLRYYENQDQVQVIPMTIPGMRPNLFGLMHDFVKIHIHEKYVNERLTHNDCFYKNIYRYKYLAFFDPDEIMIPYGGKTWKQLIDGEIEKGKNSRKSKYEPPSAYLFFPAYYSNDIREQYEWDSDIPKYMTILQNVYRSQFDYSSTKQLIDTKRNLGISCHKPKRCIGKCKNHHVPSTIAYISHYRENCKIKVKAVTKDTNVWNFKEKMIRNVNKSLRSIGLL